jgi:hypothetical protein
MSKFAEMSIEELRAHYAAKLHGVQSGVAATMNFDAGETSPKHLRVGINSALVNQGAFVALLIEKGLITEHEYLVKLCEYADREVASYEKKLAERFGRTISLG